MACTRCKKTAEEERESTGGNFPERVHRTLLRAGGDRVVRAGRKRFLRRTLLLEITTLLIVFVIGSD